jgi:branched-chain amino acid transport system permease protein
MRVVIEEVVNGLTLGSEYALVAAGLALIFGVAQIVNFAHGELYMVGAYLLYLIESYLNWPYVAAALLAVLVMGGVGVVFYLLVIRTVLGKGWQTQLVATLAASVLLVNVVIVTAGSVPKVVVSPLTGTVFALFVVRLSAQRFVVLAFALLAFAGLYTFLKYTKAGKAMRAMSQNRDAAVVVGIPIERVALSAVVAGAMLAGVAAVSIPPLANIHPTMGVVVTLKAFASVVMGGFGNVSGAIVSAFVLGLAEAIGIIWVPSEYADAIVFAIMIAVLLFRPHGLLGRAGRA